MPFLRNHVINNSKSVLGLSLHLYVFNSQLSHNALIYILAAFQAKYYLWAVFKPREDKGDVLAEPLNGTGHRAQATCLKPAI